MFIFFHEFIPILLAEFNRLKVKFPVQRFSLIIGAMLPDLIDKPLSFLGFGMGRGNFHALLPWVVLWLFLTLVSKNKAIANSLLFGTLIHIIVDLPYVPLFWPFVTYNFEFVEDPFAFWIYALTHDPIVITTELIGLIGIIILILRKQLIFHWVKIREFLFSPTI